MVPCQAYRHAVMPGSKEFALLEATRKAGVSDRDLDQGYEQVDYDRPGSWGRIEGAGDCFIDARELQRYVLDRWRTYRDPIKQWHGRNLPWDMAKWSWTEMQPNGREIKTPSEQIVRQAIETILQDLRAKGIPRDSGDATSILAEALFSLLEFPTQQSWALYDRAQRKELYTSFARLDALGLANFKRFLLRHGGFGNLMTVLVSHHARDPIGFSFPASFRPGAVELFALYEAAGLDPTFLEVTDLRPDRFICGDPIPITLEVGIPLAGGWRVFHTALHDPDHRGKLFYPLSLRQVLANISGLSQAVDVHLSQGTAGVPPAPPASVDGFLSSYHLLAHRFSRPDSGASRDRTSLEFFEKHKRFFHPMLRLFLDHQLTRAMREKDQPPSSSLASDLPEAVAKHSLRDFLWLAQEGDGAVARLEEGAERLERLLRLDPDCFFAHVAMAQIHASRDNAKDRAAAERHFASARNALPPHHPCLAGLWNRWGRFLLRAGDVTGAREKFLAAWASEPEKRGDKIQVASSLAFISASRGDLHQAAEWIQKASSPLAGLLAEDRDGSDAEEWFSWFATEQSKRPHPKESLQDAKVARAIAAIHRAIGSALLFHGKYPGAIASLQRAADLTPLPEERIKILHDLHEAYLQAGNLPEADNVWRGIRDASQRP